MELKTSSDYPKGAIEHDGHIIFRDERGTHIAEARPLVESKGPLLKVKASYSFEVEGDVEPDQVGRIPAMIGQAMQGQPATPETRTIVLPSSAAYEPSQPTRAIEPWPADLIPGGVAPESVAKVAPKKVPRPKVEAPAPSLIDALPNRGHLRGLIGWGVALGSIALTAALVSGGATQAGHDGIREMKACGDQRIFGFVSPFCTGPMFGAQLVDPRNIFNYAPEKKK